MNIDYFSPEELKQLRQARGVGTPAQGVTSAGFSAQDINSAYNQTKAQLAAQRAGAPVASMPVGENLAPVATAEAATKPSFGQRLANTRNTIGRGLSLAARGVGGAQAVVGAYDAATDGVSANTVDNIANGVAGAINPGVGFVGNLLTSARDAVLGSIINSRTAGPNSVGPELQKQIDAAGGMDKLLAAQVASRQAQPATQDTAPLATPARPASRVAQDPSITPLAGAEAAAASEFIDGRGVPALGTGFIRNNSTGDVTQLSSSPERPARRRRLSTGGALAAFAEDYTQAALGMAMANREEKLKLRRAEVTSEMAKAQAALQQNKPKPVVGYGLDGDPIITDPNTRTAVKVTPTALPSLASFVEAARKDSRNKKFTDAQLEAEYYRTYGQPGQIQ